MRQKTHTLALDTEGPGLYEITGDVARWVGKSGINEGLLTLFIRHTSASLLIQENADPAVQKDLQDFFLRLVSRDEKLYRHGAEGPDDMPAHIRSALTQTSLSIPVEQGRISFGTWQGIYIFEHRDKPHHRKISLYLSGI